MKLGILFALLFVGAAWAQADEASPAAEPERKPLFSAQFPTEKLQTREQTQQAIDATAAERRRINAAYATDDARCFKTFFVNACRDRVRRAHAEEKNDVQRVETAARAQQRKLDAETRAANRLHAEAQWLAEAPERERREAEARARYEARQAQAEQAERKRQGLAATEAQRRAAFEQKQQKENPLSGNTPTAAERIENRARFEEKQREAQEYAKRKEQERLDNERRRAERAKKKE